LTDLAYDDYISIFGELRPALGDLADRDVQGALDVSGLVLVGLSDI
jgi:hypothetical protein